MIYSILQVEYYIILPLFTLLFMVTVNNNVLDIMVINLLLI